MAKTTQKPPDIYSTYNHGMYNLSGIPFIYVERNVHLLTTVCLMKVFVRMASLFVYFKNSSFGENMT